MSEESSLIIFKEREPVGDNRVAMRDLRSILMVHRKKDIQAVQLSKSKEGSILLVEVEANIRVFIFLDVDDSGDRGAPFVV